MARALNGSTMLLRHSAQLISAYPFSIVGCVKASSLGGVIAGLFDGTATTGWYDVGFDATGKARVRTHNGTTGTPLLTTATFSTGVWAHITGVWVSATERYVYLDGANKAGSASETSISYTSNIDRFSVGVSDDSTPSGYVSGDAAWCALWSSALSDDEVLALGSGLHPMAIDPTNLVDVWALRGVGSPEPGDVGGNDLTLVNAPTQAESPYITEPWMSNWSREAAAAGGPPALNSKLTLLGVGA